MSDLGKRIRAARKSAGLSQEALARRAELSLNSMGSLERGEALDPHISTLSGIADALGVPVSELLGESALAGKGEASREAGPLSPEWAHRADPDLFRATIRDATSAELRGLVGDLLGDFSRNRTLDELRDEGPNPDARRVRSFSLVGVIGEELVRRGEKPLTDIPAFRRFNNALSGGEVTAAREEDDQEHQAG